MMETQENEIMKVSAVPHEGHVDLTIDLGTSSDLYHIPQEMWNETMNNLHNAYLLLANHP